MVEEKKFRYTYAYTASSYPNYRENFVCLLCDLNKGYSITFVSRKEMLKHLHEHVKAGHIVPEEEFETYMQIEMIEKKVEGENDWNQDWKGQMNKKEEGYKTFFEQERRAYLVFRIGLFIILIADLTLLGIVLYFICFN